MKLTVGIDFTSAARERAGIGRYARELVRALARLDTPHRYVLLVPRDAHDDLLAFAPGASWPSHFSIRRAPLSERLLARLWHRMRVPLPVETFTGPVDVFYSPDFLLPPTRARRSIVTVHDLSYVRVPECFPSMLKDYLDAAVPRAVARADLVLGDAASTVRDLNQVYGVPPAKTRVLYSGVDARFCPDVPDSDQRRVRERYHLQGPYLLSVGTVQPRKNYVRLIHAFAQLVSNVQRPISRSEVKDPRSSAEGAEIPSQTPRFLAGPSLRDNLQLLISGGQGWMYDEVYQAAEQFGVQDRVVFAGFTADEDLPALYAGATLFVLPSLYEGFGLPVAEAMACGVPVLCSNTSSLPEVGGEAALYFDPRDVDAMAAALRRALDDDALRAQMRARGLQQARPFSWMKAANELRQYFERNDLSA